MCCSWLQCARGGDLPSVKPMPAVHQPSCTTSQDYATALEMNKQAWLWPRRPRAWRMLCCGLFETKASWQRLPRERLNRVDAFHLRRARPFFEGLSHPQTDLGAQLQDQPMEDLAQSQKQIF